MPLTFHETYNQGMDWCNDKPQWQYCPDGGEESISKSHFQTNQTRGGYSPPLFCGPHVGFSTHHPLAERKDYTTKPSNQCFQGDLERNASLYEP